MSKTTGAVAIALLLGLIALVGAAIVTAPTQDQPTIILSVAVIIGFIVLVATITRTIAGKR